MGNLGVNPVDDATAAQQVAARLAAITDIRDVRLMKSCAEIMRLPVAEPFLAYDFDSEATVEYEPGSGSFVVRGKYRVYIRSAPAENMEYTPKDSGSAVAKIEFEQAALFVIDMAAGEPPKAEELNAYAVSTGQFALYPYVREYISDVTMRLGLPPLTVGVLKVPFHAKVEG
jgi:Preprotein translocase subunit SecB